MVSNEGARHNATPVTHFLVLGFYSYGFMLTYIEIVPEIFDCVLFNL
jgi:hypothetical protein